MKYILLFIIAIVLGIVVRLYKNYVSMKLYHGEVLEKTYVCPNCGHRFQPKWYQMLFGVGTAYTYDCAKLKCPACHEWDMCTISHDER